MRKILIAEDDTAISEPLTGLLQDDFEVKTVKNAEEALKILVTEHFDCLLLDLMMPVMNGWKFLLVREKDEQLKKIPVIIISAFDNSQSTGAMRDLPVIKKPDINIPSLIALIHNLVNKAESEKTLDV